MNLDIIYPKSCQRMPELPDESVDFMPTDPPYGVGFMGKEWDKFNQMVNPQGAYEKKKGFKKLPRQSSAFMKEFFTPIWKECFRVLKPGAFAFVMCIPRQDCLARQVISLEDAGFNVGFSPIFHTFASGFPKAQNISKAVDKKLGIKRKIIGKEKVDIGIQSGSMHAGRSSEVIEMDKTVATSLQAQALDGSYGGFQPKPAVEIILVAMKPLSEKTYVDQALKNRKGIIWLDEGRMPYGSEADREIAINNAEGGYKRQKNWKLNDKGQPMHGGWKKLKEENFIVPQGRFPANLLVSNDALNDGRQHKTGNLFGSYEHGGGKIDYGKYGFSEHAHHADSGSFSRYFSLDSWFEKKFKELPQGVQKTFPFLIVPKAPKSEKNRGCEELYWEKDNSGFGHHQIDKQRWIKLGEEEKRIYQKTGNRVSLRARGNIHPTVKPLKLFCYLITLGSREGDVILDPFMGSGTTAVAAKMLVRHYVGWETGLENVKIAKARLSILEPLLI